MEFLDKLVLPQSLEHITLLHFLSVVVLSLFLPYLGLVLGGTTISVYFRKKWLKEKNLFYLMYSKDILELCTINGSASLALGVAPVLAIIMTYAQLLHTLNYDAVSYFVYAFVLLTGSFILVNAFRNSFNIYNIFRSIKPVVQEGATPDVTEDIEKLNKSSENVFNFTGRWGMLGVYIGSHYFIAAMVNALEATSAKTTEGFLAGFFTLPVLVKWLYFVATSFALSGALVLFSFFYWENGRKGSEEYLSFVKKQALGTTFIFSALQPLFIVLGTIFLPANALSLVVFLGVAAALVLLFIIYHLLYTIAKTNNLESAGWVFILFVMVTFFVTISEQTAFSNATSKHSQLLAMDFEKAVKELEKEAGGAGAISGQEIYNTRCASCHKFDQKVVGPPYNLTLPKYEGKEDALVAFIKNPTKVDPAYPPMPNPGLKPAEARAVAKYILATYKK